MKQIGLLPFFYKSINELYEKYFPIIIRPTKKKELINPWVTPALAKLIKIRHNLGRLASKGRIDNKVYKKFRNKVTFKLREAKKVFYSNKFINCKGDMKNTWGTINNAIKKQKLKSKIALLEDENIVDETLIPNKFCNYFTSIRNELVNYIPVGQFYPLSYPVHHN